MAVVTLIVYFLCILILEISPSFSANECSFVRSYKDQECVYNIHLTQKSGNCDLPLPRGRSKHFRRHLQDLERGVMEARYLDGEDGAEEEEEEEEEENYDVQNDYVRKVDNMEKSFSYMKDEHDKRLTDLEGTVRELLSLDIQPSSFQSKKSSSAASPPSALASLFHSSVLLTNAGQPKEETTREEKVDTNLLDRLYEEFNKLREELRQKTEQLFEVQIKANETEGLLVKSQVDIFSANQDLLTAQHRIAVLERERAILHNQVKDRSYKLEVAATSVKDLEQKLQSQEDQLLKLVRSENTLTENLMTCELTLNNTKEELDKLEARHKELKTSHSRTQNILRIRERELISCYSAKTETFCGFEHPNRCGFTQPNDTSDSFDWDWALGETPSRNTGPVGDHTCGTKTGRFMFIEASAKSRGMNAILYSPLYRGLEQQCLSFYYHMNGKHMGTLNVYAKARGAELASVWRAYGNQGDIWSVARLAIPKDLARAGYQIAFEGITENGYLGDMAIDDVTVVDGKCPEDLQVVEVHFNNTSMNDIIEDDKKFARILRKKKQGKSRQHRKKDKKDKGKHKNKDDNDKADDEDADSKVVN